MKNFTKIIASLFLIGIMTSCSLNDDSDIAPSIDSVQGEENVTGSGGDGGDNPPPTNG